MPRSYRVFTLVLLLSFGVSALAVFRTDGTKPQVATPTPELLPAAYANPADVAYEDTLQAGETLSQLLLRAQLAEDEAHALLSELQQHQDPRRMKAGSVVAFRRSTQDGAVRKMELRLDPDRTLNILRAGDLWQGAVAEVPVRPDTVVLHGHIRSSLYRALVDGENAGVPVDERERIVDQLADRIFAWQVDFSRDLRSGDEFRILYERLVRPDGTARSGRVLGVQMTVNNRDYEAYSFAPGSASDDYFDRNGDSLRRAFLRAPLQYRRISSAFSRSRFHPVLQTNRAHNGVDYAAASGTPVYAVGDGVIRRAGNGGGYGNVVDIAHSRGYLTRYAHLRGFAPGIRAGARVKQGDVIGYVGMTGLATGPHLHYEFHSNGRPVDPNSIRDITGDPVPPSYRSQFLQRVQDYVVALDRSSTGVLLADRRQNDLPELADD
jgi:murein DD-endopeptidase MepM/ murein hydrolase activator NlpD